VIDELVERLREICIDWDGTPMPSGAEPRSVPCCGDIREIADTLESQASLLLAMKEALVEARAALHQHYVDWDGEPEDAVSLQLARAKIDATLNQGAGRHA
jgi:hypothetical protein